MFGRKNRATEPAPSAEPEKSKGEKLHEAALNWEASRVLLVEKSERVAPELAAPLRAEWQRLESSCR